jgi:hypothetical protein
MAEGGLRRQLFILRFNRRNAPASELNYIPAFHHANWGEAPNLGSQRPYDNEIKNVKKKRG